MSDTNSTTKIGMGSGMESPLQLFMPINSVVFLSFYSPIILAICVTSMSFIFQNFKGLIYLGFLIGCCLIRNFVYMLSGSPPVTNDRTICTSIQYSKYGNPTFSAFVFAFTIMYLSLPMFSNGAANFWAFGSILVYFFLDIFIKIYKKCVVKMGDLFLNVLLGLASAALIVTMMYAGGSGKYLFFNEISSNKEICYQPKNQTFKCSVYKNGELVGDI
jgi:hypothetical protein